MEESVELATIWLIDLVGSTRLATSVGPARADELRDEFFALTRDAVERRGGRELKNTGDGLFVAFSSASAAVSCAVLTQQLFERRYRNEEQQLHVRIGVGAGEATVRDGDYFGMPAIIAARLCDAAPVDGILVSALTRMLAGRVEGAQFSSAGALELKGIPEPMDTFVVEWEPLPAEGAAASLGRWPLPPLLRSVPPVSYVGRVEERKFLERGRRAARVGAGQVVFLAGEPGIGKTRLAAFEALGAHAEGFAVCWGTCSDDLSAPYKPWIEICSQLVEHVPEEVLAGYVERFGGEVGRLARGLWTRLPDAPQAQRADPETERFLLFEAIVGLLQATAEAQPLCVVLDDFHWADGQSVALLKHVARAIEHGALQVLVTYRDSELTRDHALTRVLADLQRVDIVDRIQLNGLGIHEVAQLMGKTAGHELSADGISFAGELAAETGGNPFFVAEILRDLVESGSLAVNDATGRWKIDRGQTPILPESVREVIETRVARLGDDVQEVLTTAAVIGRTFDVELLMRLVDIDQDRLLKMLDQAVAASLVREPGDQIGVFGFTHALISSTLYQGLGATRRARMHHRVAEMLEQLDDQESPERLSELALHWRLAMVSADGEKAAGYSLRAGRQALTRLAPAQAATLFSDALSLLPDGDSAARCDALIWLGEAQRQTGDTRHRATLLDASRMAWELRDPNLAARAALANSRGGPSSVGVLDDERIAAIERAIELDEPSLPARRAPLLALAAVERLYEFDGTRRRAMAREAIELVRAPDYPLNPAVVLIWASQGLTGPDTLDERLALLPEINLSVSAAQDKRLRCLGGLVSCVFSIERCDMTEARAALGRIQQAAVELCQPTWKWMAAWLSTSMCLLTGDLDKATELNEGALQLGQDAGQDDAQIFYEMARAALGIARDEGTELTALIERRVAETPGISVWRAMLAMRYAWTGQGDKAEALLTPVAAGDFADVPFDPGRSATLAFYAEAATAIGDVDACRKLYDLLEPYAEQIVVNAYLGYGHARTYLGMLAAALGRDAQADEHFAAASRFHRDERLWVWEARSELAWAVALLARGEIGTARQHAASVLELAHEYGYGAFEARAAAVIDGRDPNAGLRKHTAPGSAVRRLT